MSGARQHDQLRQRSDYTYRFNSKTGRHGWLRLTPAYSLKIVEEIVAEHPNANRVYDPFCGTGTTALCAAYYGREGVTTEINPFLVWFANAKLSRYSAAECAATENACATVLRLVHEKRIDPAAQPPLHNIERWWPAATLRFLQLLRAAILHATHEHSAERNLLLVAFCRTLIENSNAAFNHQSMSFKSSEQRTLPFDDGLAGGFEDDVRFVLQGAADNPSGSGRVVHGDSRNAAAILEGPFDLVVTSPPYANRMSYIRELRPYMYWLGLLKNGRDAGELDWNAIGGTWGIATSRLTDWRRSSDHFQSKLLSGILQRIAGADNKSGVVLAKYVAKYFDDMWAHFRGLTPVLAVGAEVHYVVGNSTFYGTLVPTELLYAEMLESLGFHDVEHRPIRKRNSKKELIEFDVVAKGPAIARPIERPSPSQRE